MNNQGIASSVHDIDLDGKNLFAQRWQPDHCLTTAPTLVLFHDSLGCADLWRDFPSRLATATGLPVVAYDRLGFGRSAANPDRLRRDFMADEARTGFAALREGLGIDRFVAFGHSAGGGMAVATAAANPGSCVAVITQSAQAFAEDHTLAGIREAKIQFADPEQMKRLTRYHGDRAQWVLDAWIETWLSPAFSDWTLDSLLSQVRCPTLAIHGDRDEYGSSAHLQRIAAKAAGPVTPILFEDCGHVPHREYPERVIETVAGFLAAAI